ncbi:MAG: hypothetical protein WAS51_09795 [Ilumatobacteraceae bacterium]
MSEHIANVLTNALTEGTDENTTANRWMRNLTAAITYISHGDATGPTGLEGLAIAVTGHAAAVVEAARIQAEAIDLLTAAVAGSSTPTTWGEQ